MVHEQYCFDVFFVFLPLVYVLMLFSFAHHRSCGRTPDAPRTPPLASLTSYKDRVACVQCTESQINNKKEYTEIYSSLSLNHHHLHLHHRQQQQHRRHSLLHVWHHRRNRNKNIQIKKFKNDIVPCFCFQFLLLIMTCVF